MNNSQKLIGKNVLAICQSADCCFLALHGGLGENGKLQALLDIFGIKYTGSNYQGSLLAMDKHISKQLFVQNKILTPAWQVVQKVHTLTIPAPCVVKPISNGSSIGVQIVENAVALPTAIRQAQIYSQRVLVEEKINGREFSVGILGETILPIIEIIPQNGFYDYANKYQVGATLEITPAEISPTLSEKLGYLALKVHRLLGLEVYSRIDFIVTETEEVYCIEANSLPGMTPTSLLPQEATAMGLSYGQLCEKILELSLAKKPQKTFND